MDINYLEYQVPFCRPFNCSLSAISGDDDANSTMWSCLPRYCQTNLVILLTFTAILAVTTVVSNLVILVVNFSSKTRRIRRRNPTMNNYSVYVLSLAVADLLVGLVVLPLCLFNFYTTFLLPNSVSPEDRVRLVDTNINEIPQDVSIQAKNDETYQTSFVKKGVPEIAVQLLGVFTHLTLFVSIYTLIAASADRLYAAKCSAHYHVHSQISKKGGYERSTSWLARKWKTTRRSAIAVGWVWAFGMLFAVAPLLFKNKVYFRPVGHIFSAMTSNTTFAAVINWYLATLILPLIGIWALNVLICLTLWRRKAQLGIKRRRSLRSDSASETGLRLYNQKTKRDKPTDVKQTPSNRKDNLEEPSDSTDTSKQRDVRIYRSIDPQDGARSPLVRHTMSRSGDTRGSALRRKVSSLRKAKEVIQRRSSESNITKTLCMVVAAFTVAVLPLVISLSKVTITGYADAITLNREVTALTVSLLFLFTNSVINCVIYGARMRDFRSTLHEHTRSFGDKIKNAFCCFCVNKRDSYSSEIVRGVIFVSPNKQERPDTSRKSSHPNALSTLDRLRLVIRATSKKHLNSSRDAEKDSFNLQSPVAKSVCTKILNEKANGQVPRPSSSGYRTDPEPASTQDEHAKNRLSAKSDVAETIEESELELSKSESHYESAPQLPIRRPTSLVLSVQNNRPRRSMVVLEVDSSGGACSCSNNTARPDIPSSLDEARKISSGAAAEYSSLFDYGNHRDSRVITPSDVCLDIDFSQFAVR